MHMEWGYIGMLIDNDALWMVNIFFVRALIFLHETLGSCKPQTFLMLFILGLIGRQTVILQNQMLIAGKNMRRYTCLHTSNQETLFKDIFLNAPSYSTYKVYIDKQL